MNMRIHKHTRPWKGACGKTLSMLCIGVVVTVAAWPQESPPKLSEEPTVTSSPDQRTFMKGGVVHPSDLEVSRISFARPGDAGTAHVQACTDAKGKVTRVVVKQPSGNPRVDAIAAAVLSQSQFSAGIVGGKPKAGCTVLPITITAPATAAEIAALPEPWKGGTPPTVVYFPPLPRQSSRDGHMAVAQVCVDAGARTISVVMAEPTGNAAKDREIVDLLGQFQIEPAVVNGKRVASCLLVPLGLAG